PRVQAGLAIERGQALERDEKGVLHDVLRRGAIATEPVVHEFVQRVHVLAEERGRGLPVAREDAIARGEVGTVLGGVRQGRSSGAAVGQRPPRGGRWRSRRTVSSIAPRPGGGSVT